MKIYKGVMEKAARVKTENIPFRLDEKEFYKFVLRIAGKKYADKIKVSQKPSSSGFDEYEMYDDGEHIAVKATSGSAAAVAFNVYLKERCGYYVGFINTVGSLPETPPAVGERIADRSLYHYRYFLNYCTFGYTFAFYGWKEWEKLLDVILLNGYNLVLNTVGQECVWRELLKELSYTVKEIRNFLAGPVFMPWQLMMNIENYRGYYPDWWWDERIRLADKMIARLQSFGAGTMLPGYVGMVPCDFAEHYKGAKLIAQGEWCGFMRPMYLSYDDDLFSFVADKYYRIQDKLIGKGRAHYYSCDPFHEGDVPEGTDLKKFAAKVYERMTLADENAVWVFQGWHANPHREMLKAIPAEKTLITNLLSDSNVNAGDNYLDRPWIYCTVNNFGGQCILRGGLKRTLVSPYECVHNSDDTIVGIGSMPEAVENGEIMFDAVAANAVCAQKPSLDDFLTDYIRYHYGTPTHSIRQALQILAEKIYVKDSICSSYESPYIACPSLFVDRVSTWGEHAKDDYPRALLTVARLFSDSYRAYKDSPSFLFDYTDIVRQLSANFAWSLVYKMQAAFKARDGKRFEEVSEKFCAMLFLQEKLLLSNEHFLYAKVQKTARKYGRTQGEKFLFDNLYRTLITVWGDDRTLHSQWETNGRLEGILDGYAAREYGDLIRDFYRPRWEKFISMLRLALETGEEYKEYNFFEYNKLFCYDAKIYPLRAVGNTYGIAQKILHEIEISEQE